MLRKIESNSDVKIFIVESYKSSHIDLRYRLSKYKSINVVGSTKNLEYAIKFLNKLNPDVLLLNLLFLDIKSIEGILKIKETYPSIKVIILTAYQRKEEVISALGAGANAYCCKDICNDTLSLVIKNVSMGACWVDPFASCEVLNFFPKPKAFNFCKNDNKDVINLTQREKQVLKSVVNGKSNPEIAQELNISIHTAKAHVCSILQKLSVQDRVQAAVKAIKENII